MSWFSKLVPQKDRASLSVSILALGVSGFTLWYTSFRPPDVEARTGNMLLLSRQWQDNLHLFTSVVMINEGGSPAVVSPLRLQCNAEADPKPENGFVLNSAYYVRQKGNGWLALGDLVVPELVTSDRSVLRNILFVSDRGLLTTYKLAPGRYQCTLKAAVPGRGVREPLGNIEFDLSSKDIDAINSGAQNRAVYTTESGMQNVLPDDRLFSSDDAPAPDNGAPQQSKKNSHEQ